MASVLLSLRVKTEKCPPDVQQPSHLLKSDMQTGLIPIKQFIFLIRIATERWAGRSEFGGSILGGDWNFFFSPHPDRLWGPPSLISNRYRGSFTGDKAARA
jgi:hypothetical protein